MQPNRLSALFLVAISPHSDSAAAQTTSPASSSPQTNRAPDEHASDIFVVGHRVRSSVIENIAPIAVLEGDALRALGVSTTKDLIERLKGIATSAAGGAPAILLNGRRIASIDDLYSFPFDAIDRTEILSEQDASRLGFPPTVRVMNFITKRHYRGVELQNSTSLTTAGGGAADFAQINLARIDEGRRLLVTGGYYHRDAIFQSERNIIPDPAVPFSVRGNVVGANGGVIDPALDALAGRPITVAGIPSDPAAQRDLVSYVSSPPSVTDIGPYRTLQSVLDRLRLDASWARPLGAVDVSFSAFAQKEWTSGLNGLAAGSVTVPAGSAALAFASPVVVQRYFPGISLGQRGSTTTLHGGLTAQGGLGRWTWSVTSSYDHAVNRSASDVGVSTKALQAAANAGGDPLQPLDIVSAARRIAARSDTSTDTVGTKGVVSGPAIELPAGEAYVTLTTDYSRSASELGAGSSLGSTSQQFARTLTTATAGVAVPIASAERKALAFLGRFGIDALFGVTAVSRYGRLATSNLGFNWAPLKTVQLLGSINKTRTAPAIDLLIAPEQVIPNVPVFDYVTGSSVLVTAISGGNPALRPEQRRSSTLSLAVTPFKDTHLTIDLVDTVIDGQTASLAGVTQPFQTAFAYLFPRNAAGTLVGVDLRPVNLARERERKLRLTLSGDLTIGRTPPKPLPPSPGAPPPRPPRPQVRVYAFLSGNYRFSDRLELRDGQPTLDLLDGASLTGTGGRARWDADGTIGGGYGAINLGLFTKLQGPTRIRSDLASADLRFSGLASFTLYSAADLGAIVKRPWAKRMSVDLQFENIFNRRIVVRDGDGTIPNRFQGGYVDPVGRLLRFNLRKSF